MIDLSEIIGFDWDDGNFSKNKIKHGIDFWIIEEIFFNQPLIINFDIRHSDIEQRWFALGQTDERTLLMTVFTIRRKKIRVISARKMNKNEMKIYESFKKDS